MAPLTRRMYFTPIARDSDTKASVLVSVVRYAGPGAAPVSAAPASAAPVSAEAASAEAASAGPLASACGAASAGWPASGESAASPQAQGPRAVRPRSSAYSRVRIAQLPSPAQRMNVSRIGGTVPVSVTRTHTIGRVRSRVQPSTVGVAAPGA